ncbi:hypothetical protein PoB_000348500 [Plakobranchus ocellatus]|uniref:Secreted protein n=1 Tax=Plakobranchus ocellatus TaxID=259542 RepID=A0AAV3Y273_9GAST|nr:hypothetical protein PoB_000348500 [Plakobranchus ocellatus]
MCNVFAAVLIAPLPATTEYRPEASYLSCGASRSRFPAFRTTDSDPSSHRRHSVAKDQPWRAPSLFTLDSVSAISTWVSSHWTTGRTSSTHRKQSASSIASPMPISSGRGVGGTMARESTLRSARTPLSRARAPPLASLAWRRA